MDRNFRMRDTGRAAASAWWQKRAVADRLTVDEPKHVGPWRLGWQDRGWRAHAGMFVVTVGTVLGLWQATRNPHPLPRDYGADYWWPLWFGLVWGVLVLAHFLVAARLVDLPHSAAWPVPRADSTNRAGSSSHPAIDVIEADRAATALSLERLTPREREILVLLTEGYANKDIARLLFISERTARTHVSNILRKLGLTSRTQAALAASRAGVNGHAGLPVAPRHGA